MNIVDVWAQNGYTFAYCNEIDVPTETIQNAAYAIINGEMYTLDATDIMRGITGSVTCALRFKGSVELPKTKVELRT